MNADVEKITEFAKAVRQSTIKRLELIPIGFENWSVSENAMTVSGIAHHLIEADRWLLQKFSDASLKSFKAAKGFLVQNREEYVQLIQELRTWLDKKNDYLAALTPDQLDEKILDDRFGDLVTRWWVILRGNLDHEIHHRGQLSVYLRVLQDQGFISDIAKK
jgi:uncharacterized damage-inducible protein DinB